MRMNPAGAQVQNADSDSDTSELATASVRSRWLPFSGNVWRDTKIERTSFSYFSHFWRPLSATVFPRPMRLLAKTRLSLRSFLGEIGILTLILQIGCRLTNRKVEGQLMLFFGVWIMYLMIAMLMYHSCADSSAPPAAAPCVCECPSPPPSPPHVVYEPSPPPVPCVYEPNPPPIPCVCEPGPPPVPCVCSPPPTPMPTSQQVKCDQSLSDGPCALGVILGFLLGIGCGVCGGYNCRANGDQVSRPNVDQIITAWYRFKTQQKDEMWGTAEEK